MRYAWGGPPAAVVVEASFVTGKVGVSEAGDGGVDVFIFFSFSDHTTCQFWERPPLT